MEVVGKILAKKALGDVKQKQTNSKVGVRSNRRMLFAFQNRTVSHTGP